MGSECNEPPSRSASAGSAPVSSGCSGVRPRSLGCAPRRFGCYERRDVAYLALAQLPLERGHTGSPARHRFEGHPNGPEVREVDPAARPVSRLERVAPRAGAQEHTPPCASVRSNDRPNERLRNRSHDRYRARSRRRRDAGTVPAHVVAPGRISQARHPRRRRPRRPRATRTSSSSQPERSGRRISLHRPRRGCTAERRPRSLPVLRRIALGHRRRFRFDAGTRDRGRSRLEPALPRP